MKKLLTCLLVTACFFMLSGCFRTARPVQGGIASTEVITTSETPEHTHTPAAVSNVAEHEPGGYCGNTATTVAYTPMGKGSGEETAVSFWGSDSVALTDLLRWLDYREGLCRCLPEYTVETEFGDGAYGVSLRSGYARHNGGQVSLTEEQTAAIREIFDRQFASGGSA